MLIMKCGISFTEERSSFSSAPFVDLEYSWLVSSREAISGLRRRMVSGYG